MNKVSLLFCLFLLLAGYGFASIIIQGDISTDTTFLMSNNPHQIRGQVRVLEGALLTIEPGVNLMFENGSSLEIQGQIYAVGSSALPIWFHSIDNDQYYTRVYLNGAEGSSFSHCAFSRSNDGTALMRIVNSGTINLLHCDFSTSIYGHGIYINNSTVNINYVDINSIAQNGIQIEGNGTVNINDVDVNGCNKGICVVQNSYPTLSMENVVLHSCASYPIEASIINYSVMGYVNAYNCPNRFLAIWDTNLYSSYTLPNTNVPYYLKSSLSWGSGAVFTLEPGVSLHFGQHGKIFFGGGASLVANGTEALPISFLAVGDNHWKGLSFEANTSGSFAHCVFNDNGYPEYGYPEPAISGNGFTCLSFSDCTIRGGTTYGLHLSGSNPGNLTLNNVEIENCPWTGLYISNNSLILDYDNLSISNCGRPLEMPANLVDFLDQQPIFSNNTSDRVFLINNGYMYRNTAFRNWGYPYVCENLDLYANWINLSFQPGVVIQLGYSNAINCEGTLSAVGTESQPITFTRLPESPNNWRGFILNSGVSNAHFNHCVLEHCGSSNNYNHIQNAITFYRADTVLIENTQITDVYCRAIFIESIDEGTDNLTLNNVSINGCGMDALYQSATDCILNINGITINNCNAYPLSISANWAHQLNNVNLIDNAHNVIRFVNGGYLASQTLTNHGYPYQISGYSLYVNYTTVNLEPGTVFHFENGLVLEVTGTLNAIGSEVSPIIFSRPQDTSYNWQGIIFRNGSHGDLQYCQFNYGGKANEYGYDASLINNLGATELNMEHCLITNVQAQAISCSEIGSGDNFSINDLQIAGCGTDGLWINDSDLSLAADNLSISGCNRNPLSILPVFAGCFTNLTLSGNSTNEIRLFQSGSIDRSVSFPNLGYVYRCEVSLYSNGGTSLSIDPGCEFHMADNSYIFLNGAVQAIGTEAQPIIFTRYPSSTGYWQGVRVFNSCWDADFVHCQFLYAGKDDTYNQRRAFSNTGAGNLNLTNCLIRYSAGHGIMLEDIQSSDIMNVSSLTIQDAAWCGFLGNNTTFHDLSVNGLNLINIGDYPIAISADLLDRFSGVSFSSIGNPYLAITSYNQTRSATWPKLGLPYCFANGFTVNDWVTLDISAGCELVFANYVLYQADTHFTVYGALNTLGTESDPVVLRGLDPLLPSTWVGLRINNPDAACNLNWTTIMNGGLDENHTPSQEFNLLYIYRGTVNLNNCTLKLTNHNLLKIEDNNTTSLTGCTLSNASNGILHYYGTLNLLTNTITNCSANGIYQAGGTLNFGSETAQWNKLQNNATNIYNNTTIPFTAAFVYWGSTDPAVIDPLLYDNEEGKGEIIFEPWLDESCQNLYYYTLDTPMGVHLITLSTSQLRLSWSAVSGASSYKILAASSPDSADWSVAQDNISGLYANLIVAENQKFFKVVAVR
ncbi:hypothetical protein MASR1M36_00010 [Candidatus Cloacimonadaceae bacterium]